MITDQEENFFSLTQNKYEIEDCRKSKIRLRQWVITINCCLMIMMMGMTHGYSTMLIQELKVSSNQSSSHNLKIENGEIFNRPKIEVESEGLQSWISSSILLFMCPGSWILAICSKFIGRKPFLTISVALFTCSWTIIAFSYDTFQILIGRSLCGFSMGIIHGLTYAYLGECTIPELRQTLSAVPSIFFSSGLELCHIVGTWYHWRTNAAFIALIGVITLCSISFLPESPVWLVNKKKIPQAIHSWNFVRGSNLDELKSMYNHKTYDIDKNDSYDFSKGNKFLKLNFLKPLGIILLIFTVSQLTGMKYVLYYCLQMMSEIAGRDKAYIGTLIFDTFRVVSALGLTLLIQKFSTRTILLYATLSCAVSLILLSVSIFYKIWTPWCSLTLIFLYEVTIAVGMGPLPWMFSGELFSTSTKGVGIGIVTSYHCFLSFFIVIMSPYIKMKLDTWGTFFIYGVCTAFGSALLYLTVPNTKSKTLKEIEMMFSSK